jgi:hypothetical protein
MLDSAHSDASWRASALPTLLTIDDVARVHWPTATSREPVAVAGRLTSAASDAARRDPSW